MVGAQTSSGGLSVRIREQLDELAAKLAREQVAFQSGVADDAQVRMVVSGTPLADREFREARDDLERLKRHEEKTRGTIAELSEERDRLLERLFEDIDSAEARPAKGSRRS